MLSVSLLGPSQPLFDGKATEIRVPGFQGYLGVFPGHAPLVSELGVGGLEIFEDGGKISHYFISGGYLQVVDNEVKILVDVVERVSDIDLARAEEAAKRAVDRLNKKENLDLSIPRALASLTRAKAREKLAKMTKS